MVTSLYRKFTPALSACAPVWCERLSTISYSLFRRPVGDPESVPKEATPEMLTAGPMGSVGSACRLLYVNWPRVSLTVRGESVAMLLTATVWSVLSRPAEAVTAFNAPAPRELLLWTSYRL